MISRSQIFDLNVESVAAYLTEFDSVDWQTEPLESMKELSKQRAQHIRDTYDYIILYHSGGSDSTTVLNSFLDNNIFIDEILTVSYAGIDAPCLDGKKAEADLIKKNYKGKINKISLNLADIINFLKNDSQLLEAPNFTGQIHSISRFNVNYLERFGFCKPINRVGNVCHLYGECDPYVIKEADGYYAGIALKRKFNASNFADNTAFFTDIKFPKLHVKQSHILGKLMKEFPGKILINKVIKPVLRDEFNTLISPRKCADDPNFIIQNQSLYTEPTILLSNYTKVDDTFADLYTNAAYKQQFKITKAINIISSKYTKKYKLFT